MNTDVVNAHVISNEHENSGARTFVTPAKHLRHSMEGDGLLGEGKHGNLKLKHGSSDSSFEIAHLVEFNAANCISKGLSNQKWRVF
ncbi:hypothetical protein J6590_072496 [Homalodisca vitripennis]|nr:hypothetical protein J6590_072496 [Homalodisca vitripennis]